MNCCHPGMVRHTPRRAWGTAVAAVVVLWAASAVAQRALPAAGAAAVQKPAAAVQKPAAATSTPQPSPPQPSPPQTGATAPGALPTFEADGVPCEQCHAALIPAGAKPHKALSAAKCVDCHIPGAGTDGKCRSTQTTTWALAAREPQLCGECHAIRGGGKKHKPIADGSCTACHEPHGSLNAKLLRKPTTEALCAGCHERQDTGNVTHAPVNSGDCLICHDAHVAVADPLLVERADALCFKCHSVPELASERFKHTAMREGQCVFCHDPHSGPDRGLVRKRGRAGCLPCHDKRAPRTPASASPRAQLDLTRKVVHKPLINGDCQFCHTEKHSSALPGLLFRPASESCFKCHQNFEDQHRFLHSAVRLGSCATCHDPHSSDVPALLSDPSINAVCFKCHEDDVTGRKWIHQPITEKGCTACHDPHGSDAPSILKGRAEPGALCRECHPKIGVEVSSPHKALDRYGCGICHDPHGGNEDGGLRTSALKLCAACHPTISDGSHVGAFSGSHKITGGVDVKRKGRDFSCVSCHDPHGSNSPKILRAGKTPQESCRYCH